MKYNYYQKLPITAFRDNGDELQRGRECASLSSWKQQTSSCEVPVRPLLCLHVQALPQPSIVYELSMHSLLCIYPLVPQFNFCSAKNSGFTRIDRERERECFACNMIRLGISEVCINTIVPVEGTTSSHVQHVRLYHAMKGALKLNTWNIQYSNTNKTFV